MDNIFRSYSESYSLEDIKDALISYDSSCLLNFYRCTNSSRKEMLDLMVRIKNKTGHFLCHQVALEFSVNKDSAKSDANNRLNTIKNSFVRFKREVEGVVDLDGVEIPLEGIRTDLSTQFDQIQNILDKEKNKLKKSSGDLDNVFTEISTLFSGNISEEPNIDKLKSIISEAEGRYKNKIPPGFKDNEKTGVINIGGMPIDNKYGDYLIWSQLIEHAKKYDKDIVFITSDRKNDWMVKRNGAPQIRPDLAYEFFSKTRRSIYCYSLVDFERKYKEYFDFEFSPSTDNELSALYLNTLLSLNVSPSSWLGEIIGFIHSNNGEAKLNEIYNYFENNSSRNLPANYKSVIRRTIYTRSSDVEAFEGKMDLFERKSKGFWKLRLLDLS